MKRTDKSVCTCKRGSYNSTQIIMRKLVKYQRPKLRSTDEVAKHVDTNLYILHVFHALSILTSVLLSKVFLLVLHVSMSVSHTTRLT